MKKVIAIGVASFGDKAMQVYRSENGGIFGIDLS